LLARKKKWRSEVIEVFKKYGKGSTTEEVADYIWKNVEAMKANNKPIAGAPSRNVMPQTDDAPNALNALGQGRVNVPVMRKGGGAGVKTYKGSRLNFIKEHKDEIGNYAMARAEEEGWYEDEEWTGMDGVDNYDEALMMVVDDFASSKGYLFENKLSFGGKAGHNHDKFYLIDNVDEVPVNEIVEYANHTLEFELSDKEAIGSPSDAVKALKKYDYQVEEVTMAKGGVTGIEKTLLRYAKKDIALLEKEGNMAITDTKHGVLWGEHKGGVFSFDVMSRGEEPKNVFKGNKSDAIEFVKNSYEVEGVMASGGGVENKGVDLFEDYESIPKNVQKILDKYEEGLMDGDYVILKKAHNELEKIGYTFEYYLDGVGYDLRKIGEMGKVEYAEKHHIGLMASGGEIPQAELGSVKKNIMGTLSFNLKLKGMRKSQDFIVYPISKDATDKKITIQSDTRIGVINLETGHGIMSQPHASGAYFHHLSLDKKTFFKLSDLDTQSLRMQIFATAGSAVGERRILSENLGAAKMLSKGGYVSSGINWIITGTII